MAGRTLSRDPISGKVTRMHFEGDDYVIETKQDVQHIVDKNLARQALIDENARWGEMTQVAEIPVSLWAELHRKGIANDEKALRRWLDDPDNRHFRTRYGSLSK